MSHLGQFQGGPFTHCELPKSHHITAARQQKLIHNSHHRLQVAVLLPPSHAGPSEVNTLKVSLPD